MDRQERTIARLRSAGVMVATVAASVTASVYFARAQPGPGGTTTPTLAFAGTLTGVTSAQPLTFHFKKGGEEVCASTVDSGPIDAKTYSFRVLIPIDKCPANLFDGGDVTYDIDVGETVGVATNAAVSAVPYAKYADQAGYSDCPPGYARSSHPKATVVLCKKGNDEVVRVGTGGGAFWVDRYEASIWREPGGAGQGPFGAGGDDFPVTFPDNGQVDKQEDLLFAASVAGVAPTSLMTWFQANLACVAAGKRLINDQEWFMAGAGTTDPGQDGGANGSCLTTVAEKRNTGAENAALNCASIWGAEDMIGNLWEMTANWYFSLGDVGGEGLQAMAVYPSDDLYHDDRVWNVTSSAEDGINGPVKGLPTVMVRGGSHSFGSQGGFFAMLLTSAPVRSDTIFGFRCVIPR